MRRMRRFSLVAGAVVAGLVLASCGSDDGGGGGGAGTETKEVEVFSWWTEGGEKAGLDGLVSVFEDEYDFTFVNGAVAGGAGSNAKAVLALSLIHI